MMTTFRFSVLSFVLCCWVSSVIANPPYCSTGTCYKPPAAYSAPATNPQTYSNVYNYQTPVVVVGVPVPVSYAQPVALQGKTNYGYTTVDSVLGSVDPSLLLDKSARLAEQALNLGQQATSDYVALVNTDRDRRQEVAKILAAGQAISQVSEASTAPADSGDIKLEVRRTSSTGSKAPAKTTKSSRLKAGTFTTAEAVIDARCIRCHADYSDYESLDDETKVKIFDRVTSPDAAKRMPRKGDGKEPGESLPLTERMLLCPLKK